MRLAILALAVVASAVEARCLVTPQMTAASQRWLPGWPVERYAAQLWVESGHDPSAVSHAGAMGIAQFMPATWREVSAALDLRGTPFDTSLAVEAGAYYLARMIVCAGRGADALGARRLGEGAYNAGCGRVQRARAKCSWCWAWEEISPLLPPETRAYVPKIERWSVRCAVR